MAEMKKTLRFERSLRSDLLAVERSAFSVSDGHVYTRVSSLFQQATEKLSCTHYLVTRAKTLLFGKATARRLAPVHLATALGVLPHLCSQLL